MQHLEKLLLFFTLCAIVLMPSSALATSKQSLAPQVQTKLQNLQIPFVQNQGQLDSSVAFSAQTFGGAFLVTKKGELLLCLPAGKGQDRRLAVIREVFENAEITRVKGEQRSSTRVSYFIGDDPEKWRADLPTYDRVTLGEIYDGIDVDLRANGDNVEKIFRVRPGADPNAIRMRVEGTEAIRVTKEGMLALETTHGEVRFSEPVAYQIADGETRSVDAAYRLAEGGYSFRLGDYDKSRDLVIDPLLQATYLGGRGSESVNNIIIHPNTGAVYIAGGTTSMIFGVDNPSLAHSNAHIARLNSDLSSLVFVLFMGGTGNESVMDMAVHPPGSPLAGNLVVMGATTSTDWPATGFGTQANNMIFIGEFDEDLQPYALSWLSGSFNDYPSALAIHPTTYDVYIAGDTNSADFPATDGGAQPLIAGVRDGFIARFNPDVSSLELSTFIGGDNGSEVDLTLALDPLYDGVYVKGRTNSSNAWPEDLMPEGVAPLQPEHGGGIDDLFVALLNAELTEVIHATFLGGNGEEDSKRTRMILHPITGKVYLTGNTTSNDTMGGIPISPGGFLACFTGSLNIVEAISTISILSITDLLINATGNFYLLGTTGGSSLPGSATTGVFQPAYGGGLSDGAIAMFSDGLTLQAATYLGGSDREGSLQLAIHPATSDVYAAGYTWSTDFPMTMCGAQPVNAGFQEGFVVRMSPDLTTPAQATYLGGSNDDTITALAVDPFYGNVYTGGFTESVDLPGTAGGAQPTMIMQPEAFVAQYDITLAGPTEPDIAVSPLTHDYGSVTVGTQTTPQTFTISNNGNCELTVDSISNSNPIHFNMVVSGGGATCSAALPFVLAVGESCDITVAFAPQSLGEG